MIARVSFFVVWTKELNWGRRKLQRYSIIEEEEIADDVNKLKEGVLKLGDNQVERDEKDSVWYTRKGEYYDKVCGEKYKSERKQLTLAPTELDNKVWMDKNHGSN